MNRIALIRNGVIENVALAAPDADLAALWPEFDTQILGEDVAANPGDGWDGHQPIPAVSPPLPDVTIGQVVDIAVQLGILDATEVTALVPVVADLPLSVDTDGTNLLPGSAIDALVSQSIANS